MTGVQQKADNFVSSVIDGYHLNTILVQGSRKFSFKTSPTSRFTPTLVDLIRDGFNDNGITAVVVSRGIKSYPSASLTLEFSK